MRNYRILMNIQIGMLEITVIFHIVLCGCETWCLPLREEPRLRVLKGIFWTEQTGSNMRLLEKTG
jgi:hypothetical protein